MRISVRAAMQPEVFRKAVERGGSRGIRQACEAVLARSNSLVPVDTGRLRDSGSIDVQGLEGAVGYSADYAALVHENTLVHHAKGEAKFLETAAEDAGLRDSLLQAIGHGVREAMKT